ncbi:5'/3'-nucleotidase SurE [Candidatus Latescibacterota bacterium]
MNKLVLITNDDGILDSGIQVLRNRVSQFWDTIMVAPDSEQSAVSHALTLNRPLRVNKIDHNTMSVDGTPTDCVMLSLKGILDKQPDLVISGINKGANLGDDVIYSGTVAGAAEAAILGVPSVSFSLVEPDNTDLEKGAEIAVRIIQTVMKNTLPGGIFLNVNIPAEWTGKKFEITTLGRRSFREVIVEKIDPRGKPYYWIAGQVEKWEGDNNCDFAAIERGNVSITPLQLNMTAVDFLNEVQDWNF